MLPKCFQYTVLQPNVLRAAMPQFLLLMQMKELGEKCTEPRAQAPPESHLYTLFTQSHVPKTHLLPLTGVEHIKHQMVSKGL